MGYHAADLVRPSLIWGRDRSLVSWLVGAVTATAGGARAYALGSCGFMPGLAAEKVRTVVVQREGVGSGEFAFLKRFRDASGRQLAMDTAEFARALSDDELESSGGACVTLCNDLNDAEPLRHIEPETPLVMIFGNPARPASPELSAWLSQFHTIELRLDGSFARRRLLILSSGLDGRALATALSVGSDPYWAVEPASDVAARRADLLSVSTITARRMEPLAEQSTSCLVPALDFIHDGRYAVEGDANYSWLWAGPDPHFRVYLGELPAGSGELRLCIASTKDTRNLDDAVLLFNGRRVAHTFDRWSGTSGRFNVRLPDLPGGISILSIAVPWLTSDDAGTRKLALCIDKIEVIVCPATAAS
jgi:hypothetical protein